MLLLFIDAGFQTLASYTCNVGNAGCLRSKP